MSDSQANVDSRAQLTKFMRRYSPAVRRDAARVLTRLRTLLPGAVELVYDNYNALVIAFGPTERVTDVIFSVALYPRWVNLFFRYGAKLPDPGKLLQGSGRDIRHIVLEDAATLERPAVRKLLNLAIASASSRPDAKSRRRIVIKAIVAKQRPRRPQA